MTRRTRLVIGVLTTAMVTILALAGARQRATFTDDFNGPAGAGVNQNHWSHDTGGNPDNHERQWYTSGTDNAALDGNGHLVITARKGNPAEHKCWYGPCQYTSARLITAGKFSQTYGHFEARMKLPGGQGMWPAFWLLGNDFKTAGWPGCGEIDVMENVGFEPRTVHGSLHGPGYSGNQCLKGRYSLPGGQTFSDGFHTFAVDWVPGRVSFSVDGVVYENRTVADVKGKRWVFDHPFFIIVNLAVGGDLPGDPDNSTVFPQYLVVDYVHARANN